LIWSFLTFPTLYLVEITCKYRRRRWFTACRQRRI